MFDFVCPGESARLLCLWNGLDTAAQTPYPLMGLLAKPFGLTNLLSPVLAVLAAVGICFLVSRIVRRVTDGEDTAVDARLSGRLAAGVTTVTFLLSSALLAALTRIEPALFGLVTALAAAWVLVAALAARRVLAYLLVAVAGLLFGFFAGECPLSGMAAVVAGLALLLAIRRRAGIGRAFALLAFFAFGFAGGFLTYAGIFAVDFSAALVAAKRGVLWQIALTDDGGARAVFAFLPFAASAILLTYGFGQGARTRRATLGFLAVLVLAAFGLFAGFPSHSIASALMVSLAVGGTIAYFVVTARADYRLRPPAHVRFRNVRFVSRLLAAGLLAVFALIACVRAPFTLDRSGAFADRMAARVLDSLGSRTWLVTDGRLDDHLRILAARRGRDIAFVNVGRDLDPAAKKAVAEIVAKRLGARAPELLRSLDLGFLPFFEDWFKADPSAKDAVAVFAAPDLLTACGVTPVPEVFCFGTDAQAPADWSVWPDLAALLPAPKGWGSHRLYEEKDPNARLLLELRRHLGLVANNRGVWLQDHGDEAGAYRLYSLVFDEIDSDNVSALLNLLALSEAGCRPAAARAVELKRKVKAIVADETRRYRLWALANYYGTVRNVPALLSLGYAWAKSGRPGEALAQIRRAADLVPSDKRASLMNMMAALMADADQREQSRKIYERRLAERPDDHAALAGLIRLELLDGDEAKARAYLERAVAAGGDDPRIRGEMALLAMMKGDAARASDILRSVTAADPKDVKAWSLLAAALIQLSDSTKEPAVRAKTEREIEEKILPAMKTQARGDESYYVRSTEAFLAIRKGAAGHTAAREALVAAVRTRPDVPVTREMLIGVDVAMSDPVAAERHARETLRKDRNSPMANYVMGSLALGKDDFASAEVYLRKAVAPAKPSAYALNDLAETLRLLGRPAEGEIYARRTVREFPDLYAGWDTLALIILDGKGDADEALKAATKAVELNTRNGHTAEPGTLITLARAQKAKGDRKMFAMTLRKVEARLGELDARQRRDYESLKR